MPNCPKLSKNGGRRVGAIFRNAGIHHSGCTHPGTTRREASDFSPETFRLGKEHHPPKPPLLGSCSLAGVQLFI